MGTLKKLKECLFEYTVTKWRVTESVEKSPRLCRCSDKLVKQSTRMILSSCLLWPAMLCYVSDRWDINGTCRLVASNRHRRWSSKRSCRNSRAFAWERAV